MTVKVNKKSIIQSKSIFHSIFVIKKVAFVLHKSYHLYFISHILPKLSMMRHSCWNFCKSSLFLIISIWTLVPDQDFHHKFSSEPGFPLWIHNPNSVSKLYSPNILINHWQRFIPNYLILLHATVSYIFRSNFYQVS